MRRLICILLLMCLPLHSFALQWEHVLGAEAVTLAHELEHEEQVLHHHEEDGSVHYDDSDESVQHSSDHPCSSPPAGLPASLHALAPAQLVMRVSTESHSFIPDPLLEFPLRPPAVALG